MTHLNTDKVENGYLPTYLDIASQIGTAGRVCELGVERGGSLRLWQTLFPEGVVVGVDSDPRAHWPEGTIKCVRDQAASSLRATLSVLTPDGQYDLIVDDASHLAHPTQVTFENLWPLVRPGGWYVIEDWGVALRGNAPMYEPDMWRTVVALLEHLDIHATTGIESITYRVGLVVMRKKDQA